MPKPYTSLNLTKHGTIEAIQPVQPADLAPQSPKQSNEQLNNLLAEWYLLLYGNCYRIRSSPDKPYGPPIPGSPFT